MIKLKIALIALIITTSFQSCLAQKYSGEYAEYKIYKNLNKALKNKSEVKILQLHNKGLIEFPSEVFELKNLKVLSLYDNDITSIPKEIGELRQLEVLELIKNQVSDISNEITKLENLKKVNLLFNGLNEEDVDFIKEALPNCWVISVFTD